MIAGTVLDHVALAAERVDDAWPRYRGDLGGRWVSGGGTPGFYSAQVAYANGMKVEVLEPFEPERNDFLRRFLDRNGPGPHHLTYKVPDLAAALPAVEAAGYRPINVDLSDPEWKEAFLHPKDAPGVVVQLAQSAGDWHSDPPTGFPAARVDTPPTLVHVAHVVADLDEGLRLFAGLLGGEEAARGEDGEARWVDLVWPGPGRVRLATPAGRSGPLVAWLAGRRGRVHHLAFAGAPAGLLGRDVSPADNLGTRLRLAPHPGPFGDAFGG